MGGGVVAGASRSYIYVESILRNKTIANFCRRSISCITVSLQYVNGAKLSVKGVHRTELALSVGSGADSRKTQYFGTFNFQQYLHTALRNV